jgi:hypothetical protein
MRPQPFKPDFRFPEIAKWCGNCEFFGWLHAQPVLGREGEFVGWCKIRRENTTTRRIGCDSHKEKETGL